MGVLVICGIMAIGQLIHGCLVMGVLYRDNNGVPMDEGRERVLIQALKYSSLSFTTISTLFGGVFSMVGGGKAAAEIVENS